MDKAELRIVAGRLRGRKVLAQVHPQMRPTPLMVREALFSILGNAVPGRVFYDIFAGTGVVGLEAISRGATETRFLESDARQAQSIQKHLQQFGVADFGQVLRTDVYRWADRWHVIDQLPVTLFLSPPFPDLEPTRLPTFIKLVQRLLERMPAESVLVLQCEAGFPIMELPQPELWDVREYSRNCLLFFVKEAPSEEPTAEPPK